MNELPYIRISKPDIESKIVSAAVLFSRIYVIKRAGITPRPLYVYYSTQDYLMTEIRMVFRSPGTISSSR